jgi:hypothetical protein
MYYKKRNKVGRKSLNKSIDIEVARLESERKPKTKRNGTLIQVEQKDIDTNKEISDLLDMKSAKRIINKRTDSNRFSMEYFNSPCVYRLYKEGVLVYVGQTKCLASRIGKHTEDKDFDSFDVYSHIENESVRLNVERRLIESSNPLYNKQHNN